MSLAKFKEVIFLAGRVCTLALFLLYWGWLSVYMNTYEVDGKRYHIRYELTGHTFTSVKWKGRTYLYSTPATPIYPVPEVPY